MTGVEILREEEWRWFHLGEIERTRTSPPTKVDIDSLSIDISDHMRPIPVL